MGENNSNSTMKRRKDQYHFDLFNATNRRYWYNHRLIATIGFTALCISFVFGSVTGTMETTTTRTRRPFLLLHKDKQQAATARPKPMHKYTYSLTDAKIVLDRLRGGDNYYSSTGNLNMKGQVSMVTDTIPHGGDAGVFKVNVSPDRELPGNIAGASLVAFRAPVPVPTNHDDYDDEYDYDEYDFEYETDDQNTDRTNGNNLEKQTSRQTQNYDDANRYNSLDNETAYMMEIKDDEQLHQPSGEDEDVEGQSSLRAKSWRTKTSATAQNIPSKKEPSKKLQNLKERTGPAVLMLAAVGAWSYYLKEDGLILLTLVLQVGMYKEMCFVIGGDDFDYFGHSFFKWWWFATASVAFNLPRLFPWAMTQINAITYGMSILGVLFSIIGLSWNQATVDEFREYLRQVAVSFLSTLLVVAPSSFWISTLEEFGMIWVLYSVVLVIINDTMAYFFGIAMGKHPLVPVISPKKTWEGFLGAALSTALVGMYWLPTQKDGLVISAFASLIGPFGGFVASLIKRAYGQKDFGALFPGHGGLVDRLDCQVFMAPFVYLYLALSTNNEESLADLLTSTAVALSPSS